MIDFFTLSSMPYSPLSSSLLDLLFLGSDDTPVFCRLRICFDFFQNSLISVLSEQIRIINDSIEWAFESDYFRVCR